MRKSALAFGLVLFLGGFSGVVLQHAGAQATAPAPAASGTAAAPLTVPTTPLAGHVIIISIDGCRPDVLLRANTPVLHSLLSEGSFSFYAETTDVAITLPSHTSMLTGVKPATHRITFNTDPPKGVYPAVPTVLELAHDKGLTTGVFSTKSKFSVYTRPNTIDYVSISKESSSADDMACAKAAAEAIIAHKPQAMLVHFGNNDKVGHAKGWGSPEQLEALAKSDAAVGAVFAALTQAGIRNDTLVIISADHGGSGTSHGDKLDSTTSTKPGTGEKDWRSRYIPWIAVGPGVRPGYDLTRERKLTIHTEDTFATACYFLAIPLPEKLDGRPVTQILAKNAITAPASTAAGEIAD